MSEVSAVLGLPYIQPAQAQKHVTHNEALRVLDVIVQLAVADRTRTAAPASLEIGARHIVADGAVGEWSGQDGTIAVWDIEGWIFFAPRAGWRAEVLSEGQSVVWSGTEWVATGAQPQAVQQLGINTSADAANRLAVSSAATLFTHAGAGHQLKVNKAVAGDTASLLFQTNFSGRAEMGLAGSDEFSVKVSADGIAFAEGLRIAPDGAGRHRIAARSAFRGGHRHRDRPPRRGPDRAHHGRQPARAAVKRWFADQCADVRNGGANHKP
jgi:hypothetical protein